MLLFLTGLSQLSISVGPCFVGTLVPAWAVSKSQTPQHCNEIAPGGGCQPHGGHGGSHKLALATTQLPKTCLHAWERGFFFKLHFFHVVRLMNSLFLLKECAFFFFWKSLMLGSHAPLVSNL